MVNPDPPSTELVSAIDSVLADDNYGRAARRFSAAIAALGCGEAATDRVEALLGPT
jgi:UDP:flavonoid glycosyltransferase YjiC (YdhE family)